MTKSQKYTMFFKVTGSLALFGNGLYQSMTNPGIQDSINGIILALVLFAIWGDTEFKKVK